MSIARHSRIPNLYIQDPNRGCILIPCTTTNTGEPCPITGKTMYYDPGCVDRATVPAYKDFI